MRATIDASGRLIVPEIIRERLQLIDAVDVEIEEHDGVIEIRPVRGEVTIVDTPESAVFAPVGEMPVLTDEIVRTTLDGVRP